MTISDTWIVNNYSGLTSEQCSEIQKTIEQFAQDHPGLTNMLLATVDGFEVAAVLEEQDRASMRRLAAMTSSILSIGIAMFREIGTGGQRLLTLEGEHNNILIFIVQNVKSELVLTLVSAENEPLGQLFWLIRKLSSEITEICNKTTEN
ncbi:roadblock/LC7 domain-containing protein [Limnobaculum xujianqingii]|uniref:roadblock/LC7 domain-containing protein n=1 Tax=Limnobaculum xujianqingii TaxID=2738837 RepID=UPI00112AB0A9|nr:roadblock/LC7 domain-containing protein [Limnobaculum xujianqingii]